MTNENYTQLTNQELLSEIKVLKGFGTKGFSKYLRCSFPELFHELLCRTQFMDATYAERNHRIPLKDRIFCIEHDMSELPHCQNPSCNNYVMIGASHCCCSCSKKDPITIKKYEKCCEQHYGVKNPFQSEEVKERYRQKMLQVHGVENPSQLESVKKKKEQTTQDHYGVKNPSQSKIVQQKREQTFMTNYNAKSYIHTQEFREQSRRRNQETNGVDFLMQSDDFRKQLHQKFEEKYHSDNPMHVQSIKDILKSNVNKKYHVDYVFQLESVKQKIKQTKISNHEDENYNNREQAKQTTFEFYGFENYAQSPEFHKKCHKPYTNPKYPDMEFATSWEFIAYDFLTEHNIDFEYQPEVSFQYEYDGKQHTYHPDFRVGDRIVEVKGDHFFKINENTGKEEMYCPYRYPDWSNEYYEWKCGLYEAKHQCMLKNNVIILRRSQINNLSTSMFT